MTYPISHFIDYRQILTNVTRDVCQQFDSSNTRRVEMTTGCVTKFPVFLYFLRY